MLERLRTGGLAVPARTSTSADLEQLLSAFLPAGASCQPSAIEPAILRLLDELTFPELTSLLGHLTGGAARLSGPDLLAFINALRTAPALTSTQVKHISEQMLTRAPAITAPQLFELVQLLVGAPPAMITAADSRALFGLATEVNPISPADLYAFIRGWVGPAGMVGAGTFGTMISALRAAPDGATRRQVHHTLQSLVDGAPALTPLAATALVNSFNPGVGTVTGQKVVELLNYLRGTLNPSHVQLCCTRLLAGAHLTPARVIVVAQHGNVALPGNLAMPRASAAFLFTMSAIPNISTYLRSLFNHGLTNDNVASVIDQVAAIPAANLTHVQMALLFERMANGTNPAGNLFSKYRQVLTFLRGASHHNHNRFFNFVQNLVTAGWAPGNRFNDTGQFFSPALYPRVDISAGARTYISGGRINYFCNAHSYRYFDFNEIGRAGVQPITLFDSTGDRTAIQDIVRNFCIANRPAVMAIADEAFNNNGYVEKIVGLVDIGICRRKFSNECYLTHYIPSGDRIPQEVLKTAKLLFPD